RRRRGHMTERLVVAAPGRLDVVVGRALGVTRADVQRPIAAGRMLVDGSARPKSFALAGGESLRIDLPEAADLPPEAQGSLRIAFEDPYMLVVSKPAGLV